jgi:hypothetical protein
MPTLGHIEEPPVEDTSYLCAYCQFYIECVKNQATKKTGCSRFKDVVIYSEAAEILAH